MAYLAAGECFLDDHSFLIVGFAVLVFADTDTVLVLAVLVLLFFGHLKIQI